VGRGNEEDSYVKRYSLDEQRERIAKLLPDLQLFEVGGSLRDEALGLEGKDLDLCVTGQTPESLLDYLKSHGKAEPLSVAGKTVGARLKTSFSPQGTEIALARRERSEGPGHKDFSFHLDPETSIEEDLARRDFTCNAMARDLRTGEKIDPFSGQGDIEEGLLRETSEGMLQEDPLRVLRGLRLMAEYSFFPDKATSESMKEAAANLHELSGERVFSELSRIIKSQDGETALSFALNQGWYGNVFPELRDNISFDQQSPHHSLPVDRHGLATLLSARKLTDDEAILWSALLHDSGKPESGWMGDDGRLHYYADPKRPGTRSHEDVGVEKARLILNRLRAPRKLIEETSYLIQEHMFFDDRSFSRRGPEDQGRRARRFLAKHGREQAEKLLLLRLADLGGKNASRERLYDARSFAKAVRREEEISYSDLAIDGRDILALGASGKEVGEVLFEIRKRIVDNPDLNDKKRLIVWSKRIIEG
jgi:tRNA nucleotidyltransferase (CCA-adding enzyme)